MLLSSTQKITSESFLKVQMPGPHPKCIKSELTAEVARYLNLQNLMVDPYVHRCLKSLLYIIDFQTSMFIRISLGTW